MPFRTVAEEERPERRGENKQEEITDPLTRARDNPSSGEGSRYQYGGLGKCAAGGQSRPDAASGIHNITRGRRDA